MTAPRSSSSGTAEAWAVLYLHDWGAPVDGQEHKWEPGKNVFPEIHNVYTTWQEAESVRARMSNPGAYWVRKVHLPAAPSPQAQACEPLDATELAFLEDNVATLAHHLGRPGARLSVTHDGPGLVVDAGEVLKEVSRRLGAAQAAPVPPFDVGYIAGIILAGILDDWENGAYGHETRESAKRLSSELAERICARFGATPVSSTPDGSTAK